VEVSSDRGRRRDPNSNTHTLLLSQTCYSNASVVVVAHILPKEFKCNVQAITRVIEAQDQLVESAKLGTDKPTAAKS